MSTTSFSLKSKSAEGTWHAIGYCITEPGCPHTLLIKVIYLRLLFAVIYYLNQGFTWIYCLMIAARHRKMSRLWANMSAWNCKLAPYLSCFPIFVNNDYMWFVSISFPNDRSRSHAIQLTCDPAPYKGWMFVFNICYFLVTLSPKGTNIFSLQ